MNLRRGSTSSPISVEVPVEVTAAEIDPLSGNAVLNGVPVTVEPA